MAEIKVGDMVRVNRQGSKPWKVTSIKDNMVYGGRYHENSPSGGVHKTKVVHAKDLKEQHKQLVDKALNEQASYNKFYHKFAQHLERQGYDYDESENDLKMLPPEVYQKHVERNYDIPDDIKQHPHYNRALQHHHKGFDPNKAMN